MSIRARLRELPVALAAMFIGSVVLGAVGGVVGLVVGLNVHPPTAWFAVLEVGIPSAAVGGVIGLTVGLTVGVIVRRAGGPPRRDNPVDDDFAGTPPGW